MEIHDDEWVKLDLVFEEGPLDGYVIYFYNFPGAVALILKFKTIC